ncbi:hypothetical protein IMZ11_28145 [Microtetraspora sp. AC03309]|uniref:hypothetical protein n=1 Tax=Microtetraspora sp. AC03309 TaxID=2779376 RepID=UPI001E5EA774|nr:hypothetical protein [Microtetraspora sp. AC03309]MCC5579508.1 hypothetical protein [Microtetraspora sp. AC03309]
MSIRLIGANPGLTVSDGGRRVAFASVWRADWSQAGSGRAVVLWHEGRTRALGPDPTLALWLAEEFTRHFPEVAGLHWPEPEVTVAPVDMDLDLTAGLRASAADVTVTIDGPPLERRACRVEDFDLGGIPHLLTNVYMPCPAGTLAVGGVPVAGDATHAFLADAEVWSGPASG